MTQKSLPHNAKLLSLTEAIKQVTEWKSKGNSVVFTNGCFDILHPGHVAYLQDAKNLGNKLILGLNSDASVKRLNKGPERPINNEANRAFMLAALGAVDALVVFDEDTPLNLISNLKPNLLVKGADYDENESDPNAKNYVVGKKEVEAYGGSVKTISFIEGHSTTAIIKKIKDIG